MASKSIDSSKSNNLSTTLSFLSTAQEKRRQRARSIERMGNLVVYRNRREVPEKQNLLSSRFFPLLESPWASKPPVSIDKIEKDYLLPSIIYCQRLSVPIFNALASTAVWTRRNISQNSLSLQSDKLSLPFSKDHHLSLLLLLPAMLASN